jgi:hypothetical protein
MTSKFLYFFYFITAALLALFLCVPTVAIQWYGNWYFPAVAHAARSVTHALHPEPLITSVIFLLPGSLFLLVATATSLRKFIKHFIHSLAVVVCLFFWCWGFFYTFPPMVAKEKVQPQLSAQAVFDFGENVIKNMERPSPCQTLHHDTLRSAVYRFLKKRNRCYSEKNSARCHVLKDGGALYRLGISGIYFPFTGEAYTSSALPSFSQNFTIAHELAHAFGITDEGEADYTAYCALKELNTEESNYAANLELLLTIRSVLKQNNDSLWKLLVQRTSLEVNTDVLFLRWKRIQYSDLFNGAGSSLNHIYLQTLGVEEGIQSYDRLLELVYTDSTSESH